MTNYLVHMLLSGHIKYYMTTHRNLYKFLQPGWESLNAKFKLTFFNHTQQGGNFGKEKKVKLLKGYIYGFSIGSFLDFWSWRRSLF